MASSRDSFSLESYGYNLTRFAREGMFSPLKGYEALVTRVFAILLRKEKTNNRYNPLLLDEDTTRRWQVALEVVRRMAVGDAPDPLPSLQVIAPNFRALCDDSSHTVQQDDAGSIPERKEKLTQMLSWPSSDMWSSANVVLPRFEAFFSTARQIGDRNIFLLIDFHRLIGGEPQPYVIDLAPLLVPLLVRREMQLFGASTPAQYRQYIERDAAIQRRVQEVIVRSDEEATRE